MDDTDLSARAQSILRALGLPDRGLEPIESYSNAVWHTSAYVVHYHIIGPPGRLEHEARVAARLPPEALYPPIIASGRDGAHDWLVTRRVPGAALSSVWPWLSPAQRRRAVHQVATALRAVHAAPALDLVPPCLQRGVPVLSRYDLVTRWDRTRLPARFAQLWRAVEAPSAMAHGDFSFNQVVWHEHHVTALLDLEMAHAETPDWDLGTFLEGCADPVRIVPSQVEQHTRAEDYADAPGWLREAYPGLFAVPQLRERLVLYAVVLRSPDLWAEPERSEDVLEAAVAWASDLERWVR